MRFFVSLLATAIRSSVFCDVHMACVIVLRLSFGSIDAIIVRVILVRVMLRHCLRCHVLRCAIVICPSRVLRLSRVVRVRFVSGVCAHRFVQGFFKGLRVPNFFKDSTCRRFFCCACLVRTSVAVVVCRFKQFILQFAFNTRDLEPWPP